MTRAAGAITKAKQENGRMGVVVHSYAKRWGHEGKSKKYPGFHTAIDLLDHCQSIGAGGVQVMVEGWSRDFANKVRERREKYNMYLEGSVRLPKNKDDLGRFETEVTHAKEAGAGVLRTVCLSGRRYETFRTKEDFISFQKQSLLSLQLAEPVVKKHKVSLAVENHKDWRAPELVEILKKIESEWVGVTLDFGNSISLLEDPMEVVNTLGPYVMSTHVKDMAVKEHEEGFLLSGVPLGIGALDLDAIVNICRSHNPGIRFSLEMITRDPLKVPCLDDAYWATFEDVNGLDLARTLRWVRKTEGKAPYVNHLSDEERLQKEEENVLTSLAYSREKLGME